MHPNSIEAYHSLTDEELSNLEAQIFDCVFLSDGITRDGICEKTGIRVQTMCGRVLKLLKVGVIYETGEIRQTRSGRNAAVLRVVRKNEQLSLL